MPDPVITGHTATRFKGAYGRFFRFLGNAIEGICLKIVIFVQIMHHGLNLTNADESYNVTIYMDLSAIRLTVRHEM